MNERTVSFLIFVICSVAVIYLEYFAEDSAPIVQECEAVSSLSDDCIESD